MFSKSNSKSPEPVAGSKTPAKSAAPSIISADLRLVGDLSSDGEVQIDGIIDGDVSAKMVLIGETASTKGEISADEVRIHGKVTGQIKGRSVFLAKSAHVVGDILHEILTIETGAFLEGHCKRTGTKATSTGDSRINLVKGADSDAPAEQETGAAAG